MFRDIPIEQIDPNPFQPRTHFDELHLRELAESIIENGLTTAILVRPKGDRFELVHGERRLRACGIAKLAAIRAEIRDVTDEQMRWLALVENVQRENLSPVEEARSFRQILDLYRFRKAFQI